MRKFVNHLSFICVLIASAMYVSSCTKEQAKPKSSNMLITK